MEKFLSRKLIAAGVAFLILLFAPVLGLPLDEKTKGDLLLLVMGYIGAQGVVDTVTALKEPSLKFSDPEPYHGVETPADFIPYKVQDAVDSLNDIVALSGKVPAVTYTQMLDNWELENPALKNMTFPYREHN